MSDLDDVFKACLVAQKLSVKKDRLVYLSVWYAMHLLSLLYFSNVGSGNAKWVCPVRLVFICILILSIKSEDRT